MNNLRLFQGTAIVAVLALASYITVEYILGDGEDNITVATSSGNAAKNKPARDILSYIPADTIYFLGGLESASLSDMLEIAGPQWAFLQPDDFKKIFNQQMANDKKMPPAARMATGLFIEYLAAFQNLETMQNTLGLGDELDTAFYSVGAIPVMRISLADTNAFNTFVERAEAIASVTSVQETHRDISFKTYSFSAPGNDHKDSADARLVISVNDNYALITFWTPLENQATRDVILGVKKPVNSLADTTLLEDLKSRHNFHPAYLGYINHVEIMKGLTAPEDNEFGRMLETLFKTIDAQITPPSPTRTDGDSGKTTTAQNTPATKNPLAVIQTAACRTELLAVTEMWPRTIFGYTELNLAKKPVKMTMRMLVENTDAAFMQQLQKLRGFIPAYVREIESRPTFGFGFGVNIDELAPVVSQMFTEFTQKDYQCQFLAEIKQDIVSANPALMLGMMTGMAAGVQGISATLLDIDLSMDPEQKSAMPDIHSLDAIITLSSKDPQRLLLMAANFQQGMPPIQLPADGTPIDFPIPLPTADLGSVKLALKGKHIVAYIGNRAEQLAQTMTDDPLVASGVFAFNIDFGKYMRLINDFVQSTGITDEDISEQDRAMLEGMAKTDMQFVESFDITQEGMVIDAIVTIH